MIPSLIFPVFKDDEENPWHEQLEMTTTPQVVVLDTREGFDPKKVVYRGQVNGMWFGGGRSDSKQNYLADALASFVKGEKPALAETAASGCAIAKKSAHDLSKYAGVTYHKEIARLLQDNCVSCHREGEAGCRAVQCLRFVRNGGRDERRHAQPHRTTHHAPLAWYHRRSQRAGWISNTIFV